MGFQYGASVGIGDALKQARQAAGLGIAHVAAVGHVSKGHLCNVEKGRRTASPAVIRAYEKALGMDRRTFFRTASAVLGGLAVGADDMATARELFSAIAAGDAEPLARVQTTHAVDQVIQRFAMRDAQSVQYLLAWMEGGADPVLRVNAAGILAKTGSHSLCDDVAATLAHDRDVRSLYLTAVRVRVGDNPRDLARELVNPADSGARWCATWLLAGAGCTDAILPAMRTETSRETLRAMALAVTGQLYAHD